MEMTETTIFIAASPQTVWSILDDLDRYPEWNPAIPRLSGLTVVGEVLDGELVIPDLPTPPLQPTLTRIVPGRELRWLSVVTGEAEFSAEHIFILEPEGDGTRLIHREVFDGPAAVMMADAIRNLVEPTYARFNQALKERSESIAATRISIHPCVDSPADTGAQSDTKSRLTCNCTDVPVVVELSAPIAHSHLCGCSKCWKPKNALFALTGVVPADAIRHISSEDKLIVVDAGQAIQRKACKDCGCHMLGTLQDREHHFFGLAFVHPELAETAPPKPEFAGFVSSAIETGTNPSLMASIRRTLLEGGIAPYDGFSPELSDLIAYHRAKIAKASRS